MGCGKSVAQLGSASKLTLFAFLAATVVGAAGGNSPSITVADPLEEREGVGQMKVSPYDPKDSEVQEGIGRERLVDIPFNIDEFFGWPTPKIGVTADQDRVFVSLPPYGGETIRVLDVEGGVEGGLETPAFSTAEGTIAQLLGVGDGVVIRFRNGDIVWWRPSEGRLVTWSDSDLRSIDAAAGNSGVLSAERIETPAMFGFWWYEMDLLSGDIRPGVARHRVLPTDGDLLALARFGATTCGLEQGEGGMSHRLHCWNGEVENSRELQLLEDSGVGKVREAVFGQGCLWILLRVEGSADSVDQVLGVDIATGQTVARTKLGSEERPLGLFGSGVLALGLERAEKRWIRIQTLSCGAG